MNKDNIVFNQTDYNDAIRNLSRATSGLNTASGHLKTARNFAKDYSLEVNNLIKNIETMQDEVTNVYSEIKTIGTMFGYVAKELKTESYTLKSIINSIQADLSIYSAKEYEAFYTGPYQKFLRELVLAGYKNEYGVFSATNGEDAVKQVLEFYEKISSARNDNQFVIDSSTTATTDSGLWGAALTNIFSFSNNDLEKLTAENAVLDKYLQIFNGTKYLGSDQNILTIASQVKAKVNDYEKSLTQAKYDQQLYDEFNVIYTESLANTEEYKASLTDFAQSLYATLKEADVNTGEYSNWLEKNLTTINSYYYQDQFNKWKIAKMSNSTVANTLKAENEEAYNYLSDEYKATYYWLVENGYEEAAETFLDFHEEDIIKMHAYENVQARIAKNGLDGSYNDYINLYGMGIADGLKSFLSGISSWVTADAVLDIEDYETMFLMQELSNSEKYSKIADDVYNIAVSNGNMLIPLAAGGIVGALGGTQAGRITSSVLMGVSAGGHSYEQALEGGSETKKAVGYGLTSGLSEVATEYLLGGIPGMARLDKSLIGSMSSEFVEEFSQTYIDAFLQNTILEKDIKYSSTDLLKEATLSGVYGFISGGMFSGGNIIVDGALYTATDMKFMQENNCVTTYFSALANKEIVNNQNSVYDNLAKNNLELATKYLNYTINNSNEKGLTENLTKLFSSQSLKAENIINELNNSKWTEKQITEALTEVDKISKTKYLEEYLISKKNATEDSIELLDESKDDKKTIADSTEKITNIELDLKVNASELADFITKNQEIIIKKISTDILSGKFLVNQESYTTNEIIEKIKDDVNIQTQLSAESLMYLLYKISKDDNFKTILENLLLEKVKNGENIFAGNRFEQILIFDYKMDIFNAAVSKLSEESQKEIRTQLNDKLKNIDSSLKENIVSKLNTFASVGNFLYYYEQNVFDNRKLEILNKLVDNNVDINKVNFGVFQDEIFNNFDADFIMEMAKYSYLSYKLLSLLNVNKSFIDLLKEIYGKNISIYEKTTMIKSLINYLFDNAFLLNNKIINTENILNYALSSNSFGKDLIPNNNYQLTLSKEIDEKYQEEKAEIEKFSYLPTLIEFSKEKVKDYYFQKYYSMNITEAKELIENFFADKDVLKANLKYYSLLEKIQTILTNDSIENLMDSYENEKNYISPLELLQLKNELQEFFAGLYVESLRKTVDEINFDLKVGAFEEIFYKDKYLKVIDMSNKPFSFLVTSTNTGYKGDKILVNNSYTDTWKAEANSLLHLRASTFINQDNIGIAPVQNNGVIYGFLNLKKSQINMMGTNDINAHVASYGYGSGNSRKFLSPENMAFETRRVYNEFSLELKDLTPDCLLLLDNSDANVKESTYKAASEWNIPIVKITSSSLKNSNIKLINTLIEVFKSTNTVEALENVIGLLESTSTSFLANIVENDNNKYITKVPDNSIIKELKKIAQGIEIEINRYIDELGERKTFDPVLNELKSLLNKQLEIYEKQNNLQTKIYNTQSLIDYQKLINKIIDLTSLTDKDVVKKIDNIEFLDVSKEQLNKLEFPSLPKYDETSLAETIETQSEDIDSTLRDISINELLKGKALEEIEAEMANMTVSEQTKYLESILAEVSKKVENNKIEIDPETEDYIKTKVTTIYGKIDTVVEPVVDLLKSLENDSAKIVGDENKIKEKDSLIRKIYTAAISDSIPGDDSDLLNNINIAADKIKDALRLTYAIKDEDYVKQTQILINQLIANPDVELIFYKNYWGRDTYKGINTMFSYKGVAFELQFHTPDSFQINRDNHKYYEVVRSPISTKLEAYLADERQKISYLEMNIPSDISDLSQKITDITEE